MTISDWSMQDIAKVADSRSTVSSLGFRLSAWYKATVPGTVLTTLVDNKVYPAVRRKHAHDTGIPKQDELLVPHDVYRSCRVQKTAHVAALWRY